jgi:hypothetical protein
MNRYQLPILFIWLLIITACTSPPPASPPALDLQLLVATDDFAVGAPRVPFLIYFGPDRVADAQAVTIFLYDLAVEPPELVWDGAAVSYGDYQVPYWVVFPELPRAGYWGLGAEITLADGRQAVGQFVIEALAQSLGPSVGVPAPPSENRTLRTEPDIARLTSDFTNPEPALYQMTVAEAIATGRPTVVTFTTPAFCATQICAPVLNSVKEVWRQMADEANFIHIEVYQEFEPLVLADEIGEWGLTSEPWTFVLDHQGRVTARLGGPVSPRELLAAVNGARP